MLKTLAIVGLVGIGILAFIPGVDALDAALLPADLALLGTEATTEAVAGGAEVLEGAEVESAAVDADAAVISDSSAESDAATEEAAVRCGQSFSPDTRVLLASGGTAVIGSLTVGEKVLATDTNTGKSAAKPVQKVWVDHDTDLLDLTVTDGDGGSQVIHTTAHHPFWDHVTRTWVRAGDLRVGEELTSSTATRATVTAKTVVSGAGDMWDLTIPDVHDFYITTSTTTSILVHNCPVPHGPAPENAWKTLNRVDEKGSPVHGMKGGSKWENDRGSYRLSHRMGQRSRTRSGM